MQKRENYEPLALLSRRKTAALLVRTAFVKNEKRVAWDVPPLICEIHSLVRIVEHYWRCCGFARLDKKRCGTTLTGDDSGGTRRDEKPVVRG